MLLCWCGTHETAVDTEAVFHGYWQTVGSHYAHTALIFKPSHSKGKAFIFVVFKLSFQVFLTLQDFLKPQFLQGGLLYSVQKLLTQMPTSIFAETSPGRII